MKKKNKNKKKKWKFRYLNFDHWIFSSSAVRNSKLKRWLSGIIFLLDVRSVSSTDILNFKCLYKLKYKFRNKN